MRTLMLVMLMGCTDGLVPTPETTTIGGCPPGFTQDGLDCVFDEVAVADLMTRFDDGSLVKINATPFEQTIGPQLVRNVWVSPVPIVGARGLEGAQDAAALYREVDPFSEEMISGEFPVGTLIVHETVNREEGHTVQVKMGGDYEDETGRDWWFGKYYDDGTEDTNDCTPCWSCHTLEVRPNTDGLWGVPREAL